MASAARTTLIAALLGAAPAVGLAAEWGVSSVFFLNADHHSNRTLRPNREASNGLGASLDLTLARQAETGVLSFEPHYYLRRVSPEVEADFDDLRLPLSWQRSTERATLAVVAQYADESTLTTELDATGIVSADAARITQAANASWQFAHAPARQFQVAAGFSDVRYDGAYRGRLEDYRYANLSVGESFVQSPRLTWSLTAFGSQLTNEASGGDSREAGLSVGASFAWSERTRLSWSFGLSRRELDGERSAGRTATFKLSHHGETRDWNLDFDHSLVPYGTGVLVERDNAQFSVVQHFSARWMAVASLRQARNEDVLAMRGIDARTYRHADLELRRQLKETWSTSLVAGYGDARDRESTLRTDGWSASLRTTWSPSRRVLGH